jgi:hypothetical protein
VYADPFPGYVHGRSPSICPNKCVPVLRSALGENLKQRLRREAVEFIAMHGKDANVPDAV